MTLFEVVGLCLAYTLGFLWALVSVYQHVVFDKDNQGWWYVFLRYIVFLCLMSLMLGLAIKGEAI